VLLIVCAAEYFSSYAQSVFKLPEDRQIKTQLYGISENENGAFYISSRRFYLFELTSFINGTVNELGTFGSDPFCFMSCRKIETYNGDLFIIDQKNQRLVQCNFESNKWKTFEFTNGELATVGLRGLHVDKSGYIYIADEGKHRIIRMDNINGDNLKIIGTYGNGINQFSGPAGICTDVENRIYVADSGNSRIVRIDDMNGSGWISIGSPGHGYKQFNSPYDLTIDTKGRLIIADSHNGRIVRINNMEGDDWVEWRDKNEFYSVFTSVITNNDDAILFVDGTNSKIYKVNDIKSDTFQYVTFTN
jgi:streptogramin lyase